VSVNSHERQDTYSSANRGADHERLTVRPVCKEAKEKQEESVRQEPD